MIVRVVVLDYFGTLAAGRDATPWWSELPDLIARAGGRVGEETLAWFSTIPEEHPEHSTDERAYRAWADGRLRTLLEDSGVAGEELERLYDQLCRRRYSRTFGAFPDAPQVLAELKRRGLRTGVCSNWDWALERELSATGVAPFLDFVVCSAQVGYRKPHPRIFERVAELARVEPERILFVGDEWDADIRGAARARFRSVHVARDGPCVVDSHDGVPCVPDLNGVLGMLG